jgi:DNA-binding NtrC family response regulator
MDLRLLCTTTGKLELPDSCLGYNNSKNGWLAMKTRERTVSLITATSNTSHICQFTSALDSLGYQTQIISPTLKPSSVDADCDRCQILLITNADQLTLLSGQLSDGSIQPRLAVFTEGVAWDRKVLNYCNEVTSWPCPLSELSFRMENAFSEVTDRIDEVQSELALRLNMIGQSASFLKQMSVVRRISKYDATVLISGETGTGKELVARALHYLGKSNAGPFVPVNCGGISDELFENELFGHVHGAYTDAKGRHRGYIEQADGGTLFLDEIDTLSPKSQATLLRFLQDQYYKPLGSENPRYANLRMIAATNTNLRVRVAAQQFRQDLLFRLDVLAVELPALRNRLGDAALLARYFVKKFAVEYEKNVKPLHSEFINWINNNDWPGNIRELENVVLRAFLLSEGRYVVHQNSSQSSAGETEEIGPFNQQKALAVKGFERQYLERLLIKTQGNISLAAKLAGKERRALGKLILKYGLNRLDYVSRTN